MVNLITENMRARVGGEYRDRRIAVGGFALSAALIASAACLVPAYFAADAEHSSLQAQTAALDASIAQESVSSSAKAEAVSAALYRAAAASLSAPRPSSVFAALIGVRPSGVSLRHIDFSETDTAAVVRLSGIADTRDHLLAFKQSLSGVAGVASVELPVDALAAADNATFAMTVTFAPK